MSQKRKGGFEPTEIYSCRFTRKQLDTLKALAHKKSRERGQQVSVADLIRSAINRTYSGNYLDV